MSQTLGQRAIDGERAEELLKHEKYLKLLLGFCPDAILIVDRAGNVAFCSDAMLRFAGIADSAAVQGKTLQEFYGTFTDEKFVQNAQRRFKRIQKNPAPIKTHLNIRFPGLGGEERQYTIQTVPLIDDIGCFDGVIAMYHDVTELKRVEAVKRTRIEREAEKRARELEINARAARAASEAKSRFLATVSHEIRTPMNAILGMSELMHTGNLDDVQRSYLADIRKMSRALLEIINDILDFSKIEAGKVGIVPRDYNIHALFDNICSITQVSMAGKAIELRRRIDPKIPVALYGDEVRVRQIITNIAMNAVKYTHKGHISLSLGRVSKGGSDYLSIDVEDTGIGIRKSDMKRIFERFEQLDEGKSGDAVGSGLGLAIVKKLVEMMEGEISVKSRHGAGSTFTALLPLVEGDRSKVESADSLRPVFAEGARVLVVDDNPVNLSVAVGFLAKHGIKADTARSGAEAISKARACAYGYDIVFMDHMMPEMNGLEATRWIRAGEASWHRGRAHRTFVRRHVDNVCGTNPCRMPIIALSANAVSGAKELFEDAGMDDFLPKPIVASMLNKLLFKWLPPDKITMGGDLGFVEGGVDVEGVDVAGGAALGGAASGGDGCEGGGAAPGGDVAGSDVEGSDVAGGAAPGDVPPADATAPGGDGCEGVGAASGNAAPGGATGGDVVGDVRLGVPPASGCASGCGDAACGLGVFSTPHLDICAGVASVDGDESMYRHVLRHFAKDHADDLSRMRAFAEAGDDSGAERVAHTLKSVSATIGAGKLRDISGMLEELCSEGTLPQAASIDEASDELVAVLADAALYLAVCSPEGSGPGHGPDELSAAAGAGPRAKARAQARRQNPAAALALLDEIEPLLVKCSAGCIDVWGPGAVSLVGYGEPYAAFAAALDDLDFPGALEALPALKARVLKAP